MKAFVDRGGKPNLQRRAPAKLSPEQQRQKELRQKRREQQERYYKALCHAVTPQNADKQQLPKLDQRKVWGLAKFLHDKVYFEQHLCRVDPIVAVLGTAVTR